MAGRKRLPDHLLKYPRKKPEKKYKHKAAESRGVTYKETLLVKNFWKYYTMDQVIAMSDDEILQAIDKYLEGFIHRQTRQDKFWDFPIRPEYLAIAPYDNK